jgi:hypothetical protein
VKPRALSRPSKPALEPAEVLLSDAAIALAIGFFLVLVVLPIILLALFTAFDILARVDTGISKLFWLMFVLMVPGLGLVLYWLFRPKDFQPLLETREQAMPVATYRQDQAMRAVSGARPQGAPPRLTPALQGGADAEIASSAERPPRSAD